MPTYNVSVQNSNYNVITPAQKKYAVGVTYDIPAKYLQNNNIAVSYTHLTLPTKRIV